MSELVDYAVTGIWQFFWFLVITGLTITGSLEIIFRGINMTLRHRRIMKFGYPPIHCDADGDFKEEPENEEEDEKKK